MSRTSSIISSSLLSVGVWLGANHALVAQSSVPAEFPPAGYAGTQYIDTEGCAFIRTGVGGAVTWTPRVRQDGKQICGLTPTKEVLADLFPEEEPAAPAASATNSTVAAADSLTTAASGAATNAASTASNAIDNSQSFAEELLDSRRQVQEEEVRKRQEAEGLSQIAQQGLDSELAPERQSSPNTASLTLSPELIPKVKDKGMKVSANFGASTAAAKKKQKVLPVTLSENQRQLVNSVCGPVNRVSAKYLRKSDSYTIRCGPQSQSPVSVVMEGKVKDGRFLQTRKSTKMVDSIGFDGSSVQIGEATRHNLAAMTGYKPAFSDRRFGTGTPQKMKPISTVAQNYSQEYKMTGNKGALGFLPKQSAPSRKASLNDRLVQVASFANPQNVQRTIARLSKMGYPVRTQQVRNLTVVMVAPAAGGTIRDALGVMRQIGFKDAFIR